MTNKRVEWDPHSWERSKERGIKKQDGRWLLEHGVEAEADQRLHSEPVFGKRGYLANRREAKMIYLENAERVLIISLMWTDEKKKAPRKRKKGKGGS